MEGHPRTTGQPRGQFTDDATVALRSLAAAPVDPLLLGYYPGARVNPYQDLLYREAWDAGIAAIRIVRHERIAELVELTRSGVTSVLHLHWLSPVLADAGSTTAARKASDAFLDELDTVRAAGGRIAWTVHNILPHGTRHDDEEARLRAGVVERADVVHVLAAGTAEQVRPWFTIPSEKVVHVEHPSYLGAYEDWATRGRARQELGIMPDEFVYAVVGAIRPYKGLHELLDAWESLDQAGDAVPRRLVVAGGPTNEAGVAEALERAAVHPTVLLHGYPIPSREIQFFLRAADVAVLPYTRSLNSGAQMLALTFGLPLIVPSGGGLAEATDAAYARTFDPADPPDLARVLGEAPSFATPEARLAARTEAERRAPGPLSRRFARELRSRLGLDVPPDG